MFLILSKPKFIKFLFHWLSFQCHLKNSFLTQDHKIIGIFSFKNFIVYYVTFFSPYELFFLLNVNNDHFINLECIYNILREIRKFLNRKFS
jgi:hypothetical protein